MLERKKLFHFFIRPVRISCLLLALPLAACLGNNSAANENSVDTANFELSTWVPATNPGISSGLAGYTTIDIDPISHVPYIAYQDWTLAGKITVMKFNQSTSSWDVVGIPGFTASNTFWVTLKFNPVSDQPYVIYSDASQNSYASVMKFNGESWQYVGSPGFSNGVAYYTDIAFDLITGTPYVVYSDMSNSEKVTVMQYESTTNTWNNLNSTSITNMSGKDTSIAINPATNTPYVFYNTNSGNFQIPNVIQFDGESWQYVGHPNPGPFNSGSSNGNIAFNPTTQQPYIVFSICLANSAIVMQFNPESDGWSQVGNPIIYNTSDPSFINPQLAFNSTGQPYVLYQDLSQSGKLSVVNYNSKTNSWNNVGNSGFTTESANFGNLAIDSKNNLIYAVYQDYYNQQKATVMEFSGNNNWFYSNSPISAESAWGSQILINPVSQESYIIYQERSNLAIHVLNRQGESLATFGDSSFAKALPWFRISSIFNTVTNQPYIAYSRAKYPAYVNVITYSNGKWSFVGESNFSPDTAWNIDLATNNHGKLYVAFIDATNYANTIQVMSFNGDKWTPVGEATKINNTYRLSLAIDPLTQQPVVAYIESNTNGTMQPDIVQFNGTSWVKMGKISCCAVNNDIALRYNHDNHPYIAYLESAGNVKVMQFKNETWIPLNNQGLPNDLIVNIDLRFNEQSLYPILALNRYTSQQLSIMQYNGESWINVGNTIPFKGHLWSQSLIFNKEGIPFITYANELDNYKATVMTLLQ